MSELYVSGKKASQILGVHQRTLYNWEEKKIIDTVRTPGGKRMYNVEKYLQTLEHNKSNVKKVNIPEINKKINGRYILYARVSSNGQKNDLERQINLLQQKYPKYELIKDIGSGMNLNRKGLLKIIDLAIDGKLKELVIVHKDRLCRFGYKLIDRLIKKYSNGTIVVIEEKLSKEPKEELVDDVLQIMNIFVAKVNGMRKYKKIEVPK